MFWSHKEGKLVFHKISIRTLKNKIHKYMISISKNLYIDKFYISGLNDEEIVRTFYKKELQKTNQKEFRV